MRSSNACYAACAVVIAAFHSNPDYNPTKTHHTSDGFRNNDLNAHYSIGMHWGTFRLTDERLDEPPRKFAEALSAAGIPPSASY